MMLFLTRRLFVMCSLVPIFVGQIKDESNDYLTDNSGKVLTTDEGDPLLAS